MFDEIVAAEMSVRPDGTYSGEMSTVPPTGEARAQILADYCEAEGFRLHPQKTRVARAGSRQKVTGLVVNGPSPPRVPRKLRRQLRAAIHNRKVGKAAPDAETPTQLAGYAAFVHMTDPALGCAMFEALDGLDPAARSPED